MSVAFVREESAEAAAELLLPDRQVSPHPNLVTPAGLQALERALAEARTDYEVAQRNEDVNERRRAGARPLRDLRYFAERLRTAQVVPPPADADIVGFGNRVQLKRQDGRQQAFRIVGEDEADPAKGSISYVSPLARLLIGKSLGEVVELQGHEIEVLAIS